MKQFFLDSGAKIKGAWSKWSVVKRSIFVGLVVLVLVALVALASMNTRQPQIQIFGAPVTDMGLRDRIAGRLDAEDIRYSISGDGTRFVVSDEKTARQARALLVREGINLGQMDPWTLFDVDRWTTSDLLNKVNLQRSIQRQLQLHIESLEDIDRAEVSLAFPKDNFLDPNQHPVTASVTLMAKPGSDIGESSSSGRKKVEGIQSLVQFAVPQLSVENIVITDHAGRRLNDFSADTLTQMQERTRFAQQQKRTAEQAIIAKIQNSLGAMYPGRIQVVNIDVTLNSDIIKEKRVEVTPIILKPQSQGVPYDDSQFVDKVKISEQVSSVTFEGEGFSPSGPAGTPSQTPPGYADLQNTTGIYNQNTSSINYIVNQSTQELDVTPGAVTRITAAISLDGTWNFVYDEEGNYVVKNGARERVFTPPSEEEVKKLQGLVQDAIGYDSRRLDSVTVEGNKFDRSLQHAEEDRAYRNQQQRATIFVGLIAGTAILLVMMFFYRAFLHAQARRRREREEEANRQHQAMREAALRSLEQERAPLEASASDKARMELQEQAVMMARERPEEVAQLIRTWLSEEN
ncbi:flagellar basal-body MS-ring/collar protein FliF [Entomospira culicis]|uniref:Flagellar M-ring protein FliF n=1 Tax=Entomospira culicis TaxID=2719989 RepID=A0A968GG69_9SPIO|nr:flagellar basal-body MS-ring/collar protein FliF [Entomospira culicis]NIZ19378.1 flagellar M-ring protein FliF [Entomospira culicis]NIZ69717.1 flagellar M-ring protein FliF [Entomospira culicis]WDI36828.1 flagellar basal-body MS-ring/collar protein FliF [Entomospira culicis]WDI38457.1 flagellar basal-body MS-ring/collar protein FliF [Entomospira culicis]